MAFLSYNEKGGAFPVRQFFVSVVLYSDPTEHRRVACEDRNEGREGASAPEHFTLECLEIRVASGIENMTLRKMMSSNKSSHLAL